MNPSSPSIAASRPNTSTAIQSAHAALTEKARDTGYITNAATKRIETPERSLVKNAAHKRMQSLQTGNVRDLSSFLEGGSRSPEKKGPSTPITIPREYMFDGRSPERDSRFLLGSPEKEKDFKEEKSSSRSATPTPRSESPTKDMPLHVRPSLRKPPQSILGENTPPQSATMLALQNMQIREETSSPLANITNGSQALVRTPQTFDAISTQILSLTSIATSLQREMAQLSRRSKDNATDLVSLKEATNARDEDIRKSLRELVSNLSEAPARSTNYLPGTASSLYLDSKAHNPPTSRSLESIRSVKPFSLPRIPSPTSFAASLDRDSMASSASYNADGVATIALLEKVIRDMGTRDGQEHLVSQLTEISKQLSRDGSTTAKKLDDLLDLIKRTSPQALVPKLGSGNGAGGNKTRNFSFGEESRLELDFEQPRQGPVAQRVGALLASGGNKENMSNGSRASDFVNEDILKLIRSIKDSVAQGGGLTAEVKALVRELRGEVLGMGREIGRKLEQTESAKDSGAEKEQVAQVVQEGLEELKEHMDRVLREYRRQSSSSITTTAVDYQEIYNAVRSAINEKQKHEQDHGIEKEDIIEAVKEAWENYKPEIEVQQFGLERDELLAVLKEGIQEYAPKDVARAVDGATREEVFEAVVEGLKHFSPPQVETEASLSREEILDAVRECLEEFEFPAAPQPEPIETGITKDDMLEAVTEGLAKFEFQIPTTTSRDIVESVTKEDMLEAVTEGLSKFEFQIPTSRETGESVTKEDMLEAVTEGLSKFEFQIPTATTPDLSEIPTKEDVLDAVKEALSTFDFPAPTSESRDIVPVITKDHVLDAVKEGLHGFDFAANAATTSALSRDLGEGLTREDVYDAVEDGLKDFKFAGVGRDEVLDAVKEGLDNFDFAANAATTTTLTRDIGEGLTRDDVYDAIENGLKDFKVAGVTRDEVVDAIKEGLDNFDFTVNAANATALARDIGESLTRDDVYDAVENGLKDFKAAGVTRDEVLDAIKEGLDNFDFTVNAANATALTRDVGESLTRDDVYDAVESGLKDFKTTGVTKDEVLEAIKEGLDNFDFSVNAANATALTRDVGEALTREDVYDAVKAGLGDAPQTNGLEAQVMERLQEIVDTMRTEFQSVSEEAKQNVAANGRDTEQLLDATKDGFEKLRQDIEIYVDRAAGIEGQDDALNGMRESLDALRTEIELLSSSNSHGSIDTVQSELEQMRETMSTALVRGSAGADKEEILKALKEGLDTIREDVVRPQDTTESNVSATGEILDALQDGLTGLRAEVERIGNKPVDMTVNYEILDTLKLGLEGVRADIDRLRESGHGECAITEVNEQAVIATDGLKRNDIEHLEVLITQLRIKVEAMESMPPPPPQPVPDMVSRTDLASVEDMLRNVQESVVSMSTKDRSEDESSVKREDIEAIETLLRNTKAKVDEMDPEQAVKKEHLDNVELLVAETCEGLSGLKTHLDDVAKREDVNLVESLVRDILTGLEQVKERVVTDSEDLDKVTKTDVEAVEAVCFDVKSAIDQMILTDIAVLATKEEVQNIEELVKEVKGLVETNTDSNAKSFEERQAEIVGVGEGVTEVKTFLEEFKEIVKERLDEGTTSTDALGKILETIGETVERNANVNVDVKEMFDTMKSEFEKSSAGVVGSKLESDEKFEKLEALFNDKYGELMLKYDDAQGAAEAKAKIAEEKENGIEIALQGTKTAAEDLRLLTDTLGTTMTESAQKMEEASKTVFERVDDTYAKVDHTYAKVNQIHADSKADHQLTRDEVAKTLGAVEGVHGHVTEYNPKILESIKDVLLIVEQHYEHSKTSAQTIQEKIAERAIPEVPLLKDVPEPEPYDDGKVHEKLDKLVDHMHTAGKTFAQLDMLDKIHQQVMKTAAEVSQFVTVQTQRIADDHEDKEKAVEAATIALEKRLAQKELVEATVVGLRDEEERLKESVAILRAEQEDLAHHKMRLSKDVASLETALRIRREELHVMESRAEGLERRILEGVIDHSRALLISKSNKGRDAMSRKRVPSHATSTTGSAVSRVSGMSGLSRASSATQSAVNMAMGGNRAMVSVPINNPAGASRRILSLNQITHNVPTGGFKRSHSVKTPGGAGLRKTSWGGSRSQKYGELNKENLALNETEEGDEDIGDENRGMREIEMEKDRRSSAGTTVLTSNITDSTIDEGTEWTGSLDGDESHDEDESEVGHGGENEIVLYETAGELV